ncbi:MAG: hypothetical protein VB876_11840 [Pirellulales bacterium]
MTSSLFLSGLMALVGSPASAAELQDGVKLQADGGPIDVEVGHAAPCYADFDGDGIKDLLVGQFGGGKLRIYKNVGSNSQPKFTDFTFFQAGGEDAGVPYG